MIDIIIDIWVRGGWLMIPLFVLALFIYTVGFELIYFFHKYAFDRADKDTWGHWVERPDEAEGDLGQAIAFSMQSDNLAQSRRCLREFTDAYLGPTRRRIQFLSILVPASPLTGLLGTVIGMIATFNGLAASTGGDTIDLVADGISQALITTQTGLIIAIPGYFIINHTRRRCRELEVFFAELEVRVLQRFERKEKLAA